jgi:hypothetical protein
MQTIEPRMHLEPHQRSIALGVGLLQPIERAFIVPKRILKANSSRASDSSIPRIDAEGHVWDARKHDSQIDIVIRWDEKAALRRDAVRSQVIDVPVPAASKTLEGTRLANVKFGIIPTLSSLLAYLY